MTATPPGSTPPNAPRDPGLQPERTSLAWRRTLLALVVADFFIWRSWITSLSHHGGAVTGNAFGLALAATGAAAATVVICGCIVHRAGHHPTSAPAPLVMRAAAASTTLLALSVIAAVIFSA